MTTKRGTQNDEQSNGPGSRLAKRQSKSNSSGTQGAASSEPEDSTLSYTPPARKRKPEPKPSNPPKATKDKASSGSAKTDDAINRVSKGIDRVLNTAKIIRYQRTHKRLRLNTVEKVRKLVAAVVNDMRQGLILPSHAQVIFSGARLLHEILTSETTAELEKRIKDLESIIERSIR